MPQLPEPIKFLPEPKRLILEALRSGEYTRTRRRLRRGPKCMCVWGVICDISGQGEWEEIEITDSIKDYSYNVDNAPALAFYTAPYQVQTWATGQSVPIRPSTAEHCVSHLMGLNDVGSTFEQLADYIEEHL